MYLPNGMSVGVLEKERKEEKERERERGVEEMEKEERIETVTV